MKLSVYILSIILLLNTFNTNASTQAEIEEIEVELCIIVNQTALDDQLFNDYTIHIFLYNKLIDYNVDISEDQQPPESV